MNKKQQKIINQIKTNNDEERLTHTHTHTHTGRSKSEGNYNAKVKS